MPDTVYPFPVRRLGPFAPQPEMHQGPVRRLEPDNRGRHPPDFRIFRTHHVLTRLNIPQHGKRRGLAQGGHRVRSAIHAKPPTSRSSGNHSVAGAARRRLGATSTSVNDHGKRVVGNASCGLAIHLQLQSR
jgi:hypothetical protein